MSSKGAFASLLGLMLVFAFQNCAPSGPKSDSSSSSSQAAQCTPKTRSLVSASRSEVHRLLSDKVLRVRVPDVDPAYPAYEADVDDDGQAEIMVVARGSLVILDDQLNIKDEIALGVTDCRNPIRFENGQIKVAGYVVEGRRSLFVGCEEGVLGTSNCPSPGSGSGRSASGGSGGSGGYTQLGDLTRSGSGGSAGGTGAGGSGGTGGKLGSNENCYGMKNGQTIWEFHDAETKQDPTCAGIHVRYISVTIEREVRCVDGERVPTGKKREKKDTIQSGRCLARCKTYNGESMAGVEGNTKRILVRTETKPNYPNCKVQVYHNIYCSSNGQWSRRSETKTGCNMGDNSR